MRQQAAPGNGGDGRPMALADQTEQHIDRGQARADQQHRAVRRDRGDFGRIPGIAGIAGGTGDAADVEGRLGWEIADRQNGAIDLERSAAGQSYAHPSGMHRQSRRLVGAEEKIAIALGVAQLLFEQALDIFAVDPPWDEGSGRRLGLARAPAQPFQEVVGLAFEGAHPFGRDIEQMLGISGGIGLAQAEAGSALDQMDPAVSAKTLEQMNRQQRTAETAADDAEDRTATLHGKHSLPCRPAS